MLEFPSAPILRFTPPVKTYSNDGASRARDWAGIALIALALLLPAFSAADPADANWDDRFATGANNTVTAMALDAAGSLYVGGDFTSIGGVSANHIAKWDGTGWSALGSGVNGPVLALVVDAQGNLYAGGLFTSAGGPTVNQIAKWNGASWSALGSGINGGVTALTIDGAGYLYAGGQFTSAGGAPASNIARWDGVSWSALGSGVSNIVYSLAMSGANLYVGGAFGIAGGGAASNIARWNGATWSALGSGLDGSALALVVAPDGNLYAGGFFTLAGGVSANRVARWNGSSWTALGSGTNDMVRALSLDGGGILSAGGLFTTAGGASASRIARWNGTTWSALGSGTDNTVRALTVDGAANLYTGGEFITAGAKPSNRIGIWHPCAVTVQLYRDFDRDGYGVGSPLQACAGTPGYAAAAGDCDDTDPAVHPGALDQTCNGIDDDCDGVIDDGVSGCACIEHEPGLVGWWRGNGDANDAAGPNSGTLVNGATASAAGHVGQAFTLDGVNDYVGPLGTTASYAFIANTGTFTIEAWIKFDDPNALTQQAITAQTTTTIEKGHFFIWDNLTGLKRLRLALMRGINGSPAIDVTTPPNVITDNNWHHVAAVGNGSTVDFYVDGTRYATNGVIANRPTGNASRPLDIGRTPAATPQCQFDGQIDEVGIYDRALSMSEIGAIVDAGAAGMCSPGCTRTLPGLVGWWPGEGEVADRSPEHNDGSTGGGLTYGTGKVGRAFILDGSSTFASIPSDASLAMTSQFTLAAWIRPTDGPSNSAARILSRWDNGARAYQLIISPSSALQLQAEISGNGMQSDFLLAPGSLSADAWAHVATTFNAGAWRLYVDGNEVAAKTSGTTSIFNGGSSPLYIGRPGSMGNYFDGLIDEPMVFNRALSAAEIQSLVAAGSSGMCGLGLVNDVDESAHHSSTLELSAPWPNPALRTTHVRFAVPLAATARAEVFDIVGRRVATLIDDQRLEAGEHWITWNGLDASSQPVRAGVYQVRVSSGGAVQARKVILIGP